MPLLWFAEFTTRLFDLSVVDENVTKKPSEPGQSPGWGRDRLSADWIRLDRTSSWWRVERG